MKNLDDLRIETSGKTRLLWHSNYWDGPHSGLMLWDGEKAWFNSYDEKFYTVELSSDEIVEMFNNEPNEYWEEEDFFDYVSVRYFNVYHIDTRTLKELEDNHELFRTYVGTHTDYDFDGNRNHNLRPYGEHKKFYKNKNECIEVDTNEDNVIGKFIILKK